MMRSTIKLAYRQVIDNAATSAFEITVFNQSFNEFVIKCQEYNPGSQFFSLAAMIANNPKANSLHYKTALAIGNTIKALNNIIPGLQNSLGQENLVFEKYQFQLIESHPFNQAMHKVAITYTTGSYSLLGVIDGYMLLTEKGQEELPQPTFMLKMQPDLAITEYAVV